MLNVYHKFDKPTELPGFKIKYPMMLADTLTEVLEAWGTNEYNESTWEICNEIEDDSIDFQDIDIAAEANISPTGASIVLSQVKPNRQFLGTLVQLDEGDYYNLVDVDGKTVLKKYNMMDDFLDLSLEEGDIAYDIFNRIIKNSNEVQRIQQAIQDSGYYDH